MADGSVAAVLGGCILADIHLYSYSSSFFHDMKQMTCSCCIEIGFSTILTHFSRDMFKNHGRVPPLQGHSCGPWLGFSMFANHTLHDFLLLKSASHWFVS